MKRNGSEEHNNELILFSYQSGQMSLDPDGEI